MTVKGSCLCGAVRYEISGSLIALGHCHCSICRKSHGAAFATWAGVRPEEFRWTAGEDTVTAYESSPGKLRMFCRQCGAPLVSSESGRVTEVVMASLDGDPGVRPAGHIFVKYKVPWHEITDSLPQFDEWPPGMEPH